MVLMEKSKHAHLIIWGYIKIKNVVFEEIKLSVLEKVFTDEWGKILIELNSIFIICIEKKKKHGI